MINALVFEGHEFPETSNVKWENPVPVYHYVYKMRQAKKRGSQSDGLPDKSLRLFKQSESPNLPDEMKADRVGLLARNIVSKNEQYKTWGASGVDIDIENQCWLIIELERRTNWIFSRRVPAVTTKATEESWGDVASPRGYNADLHYVFDNGEVVPWSKVSTVGLDEDCHVIFFRVTRRLKGVRCGMNFHVELYRKKPHQFVDGQAVGLVPLIIDPQVPEDPPASFP